MNTKTKLILVEGISGSGKTTTGKFISDYLFKKNIDNIFYDEDDENNPIEIIEGTPDFCKIKTAQWEKLNDEYKKTQKVHIMGARYWQNMLCTMMVYNFTEDEIKTTMNSVNSVLKNLNPIIIYFSLDNTNSLQERLKNRIKINGEEWFQRKLSQLHDNPYAIAKNYKGLEGHINLWKDGQDLMEKQFELFPFQKIKIKEPHVNWKLTYHTISEYLEDNL